MKRTKYFLVGASFALLLGTTAKADEVDVCMRAAAATDHVSLKDVDRDGCACATKQLHITLRKSDFDLHEQMLEIIATGADEKSFNKQMSDIMLKRGMTQKDTDAFLARAHSAEVNAQEVCNTSPLLGPAPNLQPTH